MLRLASILALALALAASAHAETVVLTPVADNTIYSHGDYSNGRGHLFAGTTGTDWFTRGLIKFEIAANLPILATIRSASLRLRMDRTHAPAVPIALHRLETNWGEGTSLAPSGGGKGGLAQPGDATWTHTFFNTAFWTTPGGDYVDVASATTIVAGVGEYVWGSSEAMVADVQSWLDQPATNFGWILIGPEGTTTTAKRFASRTDPVATERPWLTIEYDPAADVEPTPHGDALEVHVFPNPGIRAVSFRLELPSSGAATFRVLDVHGRQMRVLGHPGLPAGPHSFAWDGRDERGASAPSGVYFLHVTAGSNHAIRRFALSR